MTGRLTYPIVFALSDLALRHAFDLHKGAFINSIFRLLLASAVLQLVIGEFNEIVFPLRQHLSSACDP